MLWSSQEHSATTKIFNSHIIYDCKYVTILTSRDTNRACPCLLFEKIWYVVFCGYDQSNLIAPFGGVAPIEAVGGTLPNWTPFLQWSSLTVLARLYNGATAKLDTILRGCVSTFSVGASPLIPCLCSYPYYFIAVTIGMNLISISFLTSRTNSWHQRADAWYEEGWTKLVNSLS